MKRFLATYTLLVVAAAALIAGGNKEAKADPEEAPAGSMMMMSNDLPMYLQVDYTTIDEAASYAANGPAILFFYATWCPTCQAAMKDLRENGSEVASDITLVIVDYDKYTDLKKRYDITYQHTFVQIDGNGNAIKKWNGGGVDMINREAVRS